MRKFSQFTTNIAKAAYTRAYSGPIPATFPRVTGTRVDPNDRTVLSVQISDKCVANVSGKSSEVPVPHAERTVRLPVEWVLDNDVTMRHSTGQKTHGVFDICKTMDNLPHIVKAEFIKAPEGKSTIAVTLSDDKVINIRASDVVKYGGRPELQSHPCRTFQVENPDADRDVSHFDFKAFTEQQGDTFTMGLLSLAADGLIIIDGCPDTNSTESVVKLARAFDVEHPTLYGTSWTVQTAPSEGPKNNVAYTAEYLDFHHDLVYYQAPPGLQLLHCQKFEDSVQGGESIFLDAFLVAEELRKRDPKAFKTLSEVPAAFMKDDLERERPAQYYYASPHIHTNHQGVIMEMRWAPAFEAPLPVADVETAREYYRARSQFTRIMDEMRAKYTLKFRLKPGQCVIFQQTRVLHGREAFTEVAPHSRVLRGCYVGIDEFWNRVSVEVYNKTGTTVTLPRGNCSYY